MPETRLQRCLFLPCSNEQIWALPQSALAEIVTLANVGDKPPSSIEWRSRELPVLDLDPEGTVRWSDTRSATGLLAVLLGVEGSGCPYFAVSIRGQGLGLGSVPTEEIHDCPDLALQGSLAAFRWREVIYQVPDLVARQESLASWNQHPDRLPQAEAAEVS